MLKVAIFCVPGCTVAVKTIDYFRQKGFDISLVIVEMARRQKYSLAERQFNAAHEQFRGLIMKSVPAGQNGNKSLAKTLWLKIPPNMRSGLKQVLPESLASANDIVSKALKRLTIPVVRVDKHSSQKTREILERHGISYVLLASSNWLIKDPLLSMKDTRVINAHCAKLPRHRSLDSLPWSVIENDKVGLTTHFVDAGIDTGPILRFMEVRPQPGDNLISLRDRVNARIPDLFWESIIGLKDGTITPAPQKETEGVHHRPMTVDQLLQAERLLQERIRSETAS